MLTKHNTDGQSASAQTVNDVYCTLQREGAEAAAHRLAFDVARERRALSATMGSGTAGGAYKAYLEDTTRALERAHILPELSLAVARAYESSSGAERNCGGSKGRADGATNNCSLDGAGAAGVDARSVGAAGADAGSLDAQSGRDTKQQQALQQLEQLPQNAELNSGSVLYDIARDALVARSGITHEASDSDAILRECNRIMVLNGYPDAHLDGKSNITMADLPAAWNSVSDGQNFKLYDQAQLQRLSELPGSGSDSSSTSTNNRPPCSKKNPGDNQSSPPPPPGENNPSAAAQPGDTSSAPRTPQPGDNTAPSPGSDNNQGQSPSPTNPADFFICQFESAKYNPNGPASSEDCGPTSLAMIAKYYGASFKDVSTGKTIDSQTADPEALVRGVRGLMTGSDKSKDGTVVSQVASAAHDMGFQTSPVDGVSDLNLQLDQGRMVVLGGNPVGYEKDLGLHYGIGGTIYNGGHFITIVGRQGDNYIVNDPATNKPGMVLTAKQVADYIKNSGGSGEVGVAVYP